MFCELRAALWLGENVNSRLTVCLGIMTLDVFVNS